MPMRPLAKLLVPHSTGDSSKQQIKPPTLPTPGHPLSSPGTSRDPIFHDSNSTTSSHKTSSPKINATTPMGSSTSTRTTNASSQGASSSGAKTKPTNIGYQTTSSSIPTHNVNPNIQTNTSNSGMSILPSFTSNTQDHRVRRIWVKRIDATPTTLQVHQQDIIDDVKLLIMNKYPNTLGRTFDPADLHIRMDLLVRSSNNINNQNNTNKRKINRPTEHMGFKPQVKGANYSLVNLEPDQNVWLILDHYYPGGMSMSEAFIIEPPVQYNLHKQASLSNMNPQFNLFPQNQGQQQQQLQSIPQAQSSIGMHNINSDDEIRGIGNKSVYQPKPESAYANMSLTEVNGGTFPGYHSNVVDPSSQNRLVLPVPINIHRGVSPLHRRAHLNPPMSPLYNSPQNNTFNNLNNVTYNNNAYGYGSSIYNGHLNSNGSISEVVPTNVTAVPHNSSEINNHGSNKPILLLPKNFSLGSNNELNYKKRLLIDDEYLAGHKQSLIKELNESNANITSIGTTKLNSSTSELGNAADIKNDEKNKKIGLHTSSPVEEKKKIEGIEKKDGRTDKISVKKEGETLKTSNNSSSVNGSKTSTKKSVKLERKDSGNSTKEKRNINKPQLAIEQVLPSISVLVVEDNAINQAILGAFLRKHKIHYQIAKNGQEAIDKWRKGGFHLVLMDIQLPVKSGIEVTKEIRHLEKINKIGVFNKKEIGFKIHNDIKPEDKLDLSVFRSPIIIVALTASLNSSTDRKKALMAGCNDYLTKPVNLVWLQNKITEWGCMQALIDFDGWQRIGKSGTKMNNGEIGNRKTEKTIPKIKLSS